MNITKKSLLGRIWFNRQVYLLLLPGVLFYFLFCYVPMAGLQLAFKQFNARLGIWGSRWVGMLNYTYVLRDPVFWRAFRNTIIISLERILFQFPVPVILALLINELNSRRYKRVLQTIYTFPNFLSWVIISGIMFNLFEATGLVNSILGMFGFESFPFLTSTKLIRPLLYITENWKSAGWAAIIYLAAISGIEMEQYESAIIDGTSRLQRMLFITLPGIQGTIIVMFILSMGNIMNAGFDQVFNLTNAVVQDRIDILDVYIYRITFQGNTDFGFSTAISLMKAVINFTFLLSANQISKLITKTGIFS
ncbi:MAG: ABC transporter permease subunit [Treponema sp.]|jgi:putative aldouronate transport system permease protein|nr:ABC transporter permease subunit [Treponema sp.]